MTAVGEETPMQEMQGATSPDVKSNVDSVFREQSLSAEPVAENREATTTARLNSSDTKCSSTATESLSEAEAASKGGKVHHQVLAASTETEKGRHDCGAAGGAADVQYHNISRSKESQAACTSSVGISMMQGNDKQADPVREEAKREAKTKVINRASVPGAVAGTAVMEARNTRYHNKMAANSYPAPTGTSVPGAHSSHPPTRPEGKETRMSMSESLAQRRQARYQNKTSTGNRTAATTSGQTQLTAHQPVVAVSHTDADSTKQKGKRGLRRTALEQSKTDKSPLTGSSQGTNALKAQVPGAQFALNAMSSHAKIAMCHSEDDPELYFEKGLAQCSDAESAGTPNQKHLEESKVPRNSDPDIELGPNAEPDEFLIEATLVEDNEEDDGRKGKLSSAKSEPKLLVVAEAVNAEGVCSKRNMSILLILLILTGISVGITCGVGACSAEDKEEPRMVFVNLTSLPTQAPTGAPTAPSAAPSSAPSMAPSPLVFDGIPQHSLQAMQDPGSPQSRAYTWVQSDPLLMDYDNKRRLQRFALATIYYATGGDNWKENDGWLSYDQDECTWFSKPDPNAYPNKPDYLCNKEHEFLYLSPWDNFQAGSIPPQVGLLTALVILDLADGRLTGTIPTEIGNLQLRHLYLNNNALDGTIPSEVGGLSSLKNFALEGNSLTGKVPSEVGRLTQLIMFSLYENSVTGQIPSEMGNMKQLRNVELDTNMLSATIPTELGLMESTKELYLYRNRLQGSIPSEIGFLSNLVDLQLHENYLTSTIPIELMDLALLEVLALEDNELSGDVANLRAGTLLETFVVHGNDGLTGTFPTIMCTLDEFNFTCTPDLLCGCSCGCLEHNFTSNENETIAPHRLLQREGYIPPYEA